MRRAIVPLATLGFVAALPDPNALAQPARAGMNATVTAK
jgi:hypothetical protein